MAVTADEKKLMNNATPGLAKAKLGDKVAAADAATQPATATTRGVVLRGAHVANAAGANPTQAEYNALLTSLRDAGIIAPPP